MTQLTIEIDDQLAELLQRFVSTREGWNDSRIAQAAFSLFLMQNGNNEPAVSRIYLDSLFAHVSID